MAPMPQRLGPALLCLSVLLIASCSSFEPARGGRSGHQASEGVLDLRSWDFGRQGSVDLEGEWDFASGRLLDGAAAAAFSSWQPRKVPDFWKAPEGGDRYGTGAGTYRLRILLPPLAPPLGIRNYNGCNAFELEASGRLVAAVGRPALSRALARSAYAPGVFPVEAAAAPAGKELVLLLRASNWDYRYGGLWRAPSLGSYAALASSQERSRDISLLLSAAMAALAINSLLIFANRGKERSFLLFAVFALAVGLRPLVTGEYSILRLLPGLSFDALVRLEYATAFVSVPAAVAFILDFFPIEGRRRWALALLPPFGVFALCDLFLPLYWLTWIIFAFYALSLASLGAAAYLLASRVLPRRLQGGLTVFAGGLGILLCGANDILYSSHIVRTANLLPYALASLVFLLALVLARQQAGAFARLERSLAEKEILLKEVHHRVKNSLQIVTSIATMQAGRSHSSEAVALSDSLKERIRAISLVHEKLYDLDSGDRIDLGSYASSLVELALSSYEAEGCRIEARVEAESLAVDAALCVDTGLVLSELVTNAVRHGLLPKGGGSLSVSIRRKGDFLVLEVGDDGQGFPEGFDPATTTSLGYKMARALVQRRSGSIEITKGARPRASCSMRLADSHPVG